MQIEHKVTKWKCTAASHPEPRIIDTEADFVAHTESEHKGAFTFDEMLELANLGRYEVPRELDVDLWSECPLCMVSFEDQDAMAVYGHIAEDLVEYALLSLPESPYPVTNQSQQASSNYSSIGDRVIGQRQESEVETEKLIPWSLWEIESPQTEKGAESYKADLTDIPDASDTQVLADIWNDIQVARQKRLLMEPDPSQHLLREYKNEVPPDGKDAQVSGEIGKDLSKTRQERLQKATSTRSTTFSAISRIENLVITPSGIPELVQFVGRKKELNKIKEAIQGDGSQRRVVVLHGLSGIGKTQLAIAFVKEHREAYSTVFWLNGKNEDTLKRSFAGIANRLNNEYPGLTLLKMAVEERNTDQMVAAIKQWLSIPGNTRWLLVFDNVDNLKFPDIKDPQVYDVRFYFPEADQGSILISTRSSRLKIGEAVSVRKLLDIQESIKILASTSGREISDQGILYTIIIEQGFRN